MEVTLDLEVPERQIVTMRTFNHPVDSLWRAWSDPQVIPLWWGPDGFTSTIDRFELHADGAWVLTMHGPDGTDYPNDIVFDEVAEERLIRYRHLSEPQFTVTVEFAAEDPASTTVRFIQLFGSKEQRDAVAVYAEAANEQFMARLGAVLDAQ
jgi:uncharacterized protein YndB with AHSA1/START domain